MAWEIPFSKTSVYTWSYGDLLDAANSMFVSAGVTISSPEGIALGTESWQGQRLIVHGTLVGGIGMVASGVFDSSIEVGGTGRITGLGDNALRLSGESIRVENDGVIESFSPAHAVISLAGENHGLTSSVSNSGLIEGGHGIYVTGFATTFRLDNLGTIRATEIAVQDLTGGVTTVVNSGLIVGDVLLGGGADRYDGRGGQLRGDLLGEGGNDRLFGGSGADRMDGGLGQDTLTGGKGADTFVFNVAPAVANRDRITDWSGSDRIRLDDADFRALDDGTLAGRAFHASASGRAHDATDRILYETDTGVLRYDPDGKGGKGASFFAVLDDHPSLDQNDFFVF